MKYWFIIIVLFSAIAHPARADPVRYFAGVEVEIGMMYSRGFCKFTQESWGYGNINYQADCTQWIFDSAIRLVLVEKDQHAILAGWHHQSIPFDGEWRKNQPNPGLNGVGIWYKGRIDFY